VYSLGIILFEMSTGKVPFDADNFMGILTQHLYKAPPALLSFVVTEHDIPAGLEAIVMKCLAKQPELRYDSMDHLVADIERLERGTLPDASHDPLRHTGGFEAPADYFGGAQGPSSGPASLPVASQPTHEPPKKSFLWLAGAGGALVAALVGGAVLMLPRVVRNTPSGQAPAPANVESSAPAPATPQSAVPALSSQAPASSAPAGAPPTVAVAPQKQRVTVSADPSDAQMALEDGPLQPGPLAVNLGPGEIAHVKFEKKGYLAQTVTIDASEIDPQNPFKHVVLIRTTTRSAPRGPKPPPSASPTVASTRLVCPPGMKPDMFGKACEKPLDPDLKK
jgi:serine/threonine-protein kinase